MTIIFSCQHRSYDRTRDSQSVMTDFKYFGSKYVEQKFVLSHSFWKQFPEKKTQMEFFFFQKEAFML